MGNGDICKHVAAFHNVATENPHSRYLSWEHCYRVFRDVPDDADYAALHLGFYLASWGMYRGSSFLLQNDYKIHIPAVKVMLDNKYAVLRHPDLAVYQQEDNIKLLFELIVQIKELYCETAHFREGQASNVTDTLATKILMGTLGCVPAYDRFFKDGLQAEKLPHSILNEKSFTKLIDHCLLHEAEFQKARNEISSNDFDYPIMKVIDMYFWQIGFSKSDEPTSSPA